MSSGSEDLAERSVHDRPSLPSTPLAAVIAEARAITLSYRGHVAARDVSLTLRAGEVYALLGPNGSGKTSLLGALCGHLPLRAGAVAVLGEDPRHSPRARGAIGLVPQDVALYPTLTVRENLDLLGRLARPRGARDGVRAADTRSDDVRRVLAGCKLEAVAERPVRTLSGGFQRRVNLAVALLGNPALLLLDEPIVGIDRDAAEAIGDVLKAQRARGAAVLLISHDLDHVATVADRVGVMVAGRLIRDVPIAEFLRNGAGREITVALERVPSQAGRSLLDAHGLRPCRDPLLWTGRAGPAFAGVDEILAGLDAAGLAVREAGVRRRGLAAAYEAVLARAGA